MFKVWASVVFVIAVLVGGYFTDASFHAKVASMLGKKSEKVDSAYKSAPQQSSSSSSDALSRITGSGVIKVSVQDPSKPFFYTENSRAKGFNVDFMNALFAQDEFGGKHITIEPHAVDAYEKVPKQLVENKDINIAIDGLTFGDDDVPGVVYSIPYVKDFGYSLIVAGNSSIKVTNDLNGKTIGILKGDPDVKAYAEKEFPSSKLVELSDKADENGKWIVGYINTHMVDAVIYDYPFAVSEIDGTSMKFAITKLVGSNIEYKIGVRKEDADLLDAINSAIRKVTDTDDYGRMLRKYFMSNKVVAAKSVSTGESLYVVNKGDTLSTIAQATYGDKMRFADIQSRNNLANPNFITIGQKLVIPK